MRFWGEVQNACFRSSDQPCASAGLPHVPPQRRGAGGGRHPRRLGQRSRRLCVPRAVWPSICVCAGASYGCILRKFSYQLRWAGAHLIHFRISRRLVCCAQEHGWCCRRRQRGTGALAQAFPQYFKKKVSQLSFRAIL